MSTSEAGNLLPGAYLQALEAELRPELQVIVPIDAYERLFDGSPESAVTSVLQEANLALEYGRQIATPTRFRLPEAVASHVRTADAIRPYDEAEQADLQKSIKDLACLQAEPRLIRSVRRLVQGRGHVVRPDRVFFDKNGPFAFGKSSGTEIVYAWRDGVIDTEAGALHVPAASFIDVVYPKNSPCDPMQSDKKLVSLEGAPLPSYARLLRFSTELLDRCVTHDAHDESISQLFQKRVAADVSVLDRANRERIPDLRHELPMTLNFSAAWVGSAVCELLKYGDVDRPFKKS